MRDFRDTMEFAVESTAWDIARDVDRIAMLASVHPHLVRKEVQTLATASDVLAELVAKLTEKEAAE